MKGTRVLITIEKIQLGDDWWEEGQEMILDMASGIKDESLEESEMEDSSSGRAVMDRRYLTRVHLSKTY